MSAPKVSIIVPVWQESYAIEAALNALKPWRDAGHEVIVVDGGSNDGTPEKARSRCDRLITTEPGRAHQMNAGAACAQGAVLVFLHVDTRLPDGAAGHLAAFYASPRQWGRFDVTLSERRLLFRMIAWFMNQRSRLTGIATGDQAIFVRRTTFDALGGFACIPLMEDVEFCRRLKLTSPPFCIHEPVVTDSRRWQQQGVWRTIGLMWRLRWRYWRGDSPDSLAKVYRSDVRNLK
ncbi:TIGR04283 family arsenosugar biosynthesis glycosyltransferase [Marinobacter caseinilyticus]|uniref:TIGR04283 family arsenosugar biosynthesis glycosyltransferase n=1 Tax=Marinobacter caseinilyticus TaxID=2692195 RepID=UPI001F020B3E|nr:TIGR04283 family arsenosugar biosynthesis glycosyltransferase [Marinobacter caseinilyticus]